MRCPSRRKCLSLLLVLDVDLDISWKTTFLSLQILVLRSIKFGDYRIRLNLNKEKNEKAVGVIPYSTLRFLYSRDDPRSGG